MNCPRCRHDNPAEQKFCGECGARLTGACPACGAPHPPGQKFCGECGGRLGEAPAGRFTSPEAYTPRHLAEKVLTSRSALEGERKQVTVLFADLKGSMELLADRDPEAARQILDPVLELMMEAVHRYEGTVNQVLGDGVMALFGAPLAHEDHAVRACYAALRMQAAATRYGDAVRRAEGVPVRIRVGLNSGEVVVRAIGSDLRMDYTAVGQTTHLAARMEQLAAPGAILLTADTLTLAEGHVEVRAVGPTPVKGLAGPVEVYELLGASGVRSRFAAAASRGLTKFVGRAPEMEELGRALDDARAGRGQLVAVVGEPGVGKSRLYYEFTRSHRVRDCLVVESASVSYGRATAYLPVIELLRSYFRIEPRDEARVVREKVTGRLLALDRALEPFLPALLWVLEVAPGDPGWEHLEPRQRRQQTLEGVKRLLLRESQVQPLIVVFEDLHWLDAETQALVDALVDSLPAARALLLANYRPEYQHGWGSRTYYRQLRIDPLPAASAHELLDALLGDDPSVRPLKAALVQRTEGTPLFLEESVRTLVETRGLVGTRGGYRLQQPLDTIQVPATVTALLAARIDRLAPEEKAVLQAASVIGTDVPFGLLRAIAELPDEPLRRHLGRLQAAEFLYETTLFPELEHTFKHALTHEVAYGTLLGDRRRTLHARIVEAIERLYGDRLGEQVERLAHHAVRGEVWERAVAYLLEAGARAFRRSANAEAIAHLNQGLELVERLAPGPERTRRELRLLLTLGPTLQSARGFNVPEVERTYARARGLATEVGEPADLYQALWGLWLYTVGQGRFGDGRRLGQELLALAERLGDPALRLEAHHAMAPSTLWTGEPEATRRHGEDGVALYDRDRDRGLAFLYGGHDPGVCCRMHSGIALWFLGYPEAALGQCRAGLALATELAHVGTVVNALPFAGTVHQLRGDTAATGEVAASLIAVSAEHGYAQWLPFGRILEAWALAQGARDPACIERLRAAIAAYRAAGNEFYVPYFLGLLAGVQLQQGDVAGGLESVATGLAIVAEKGLKLLEPELCRLQGELLLLGPGEATGAELVLRRAIDAARAQRARSLELRAAVSLGRLWQRQGRRAEARRLVGDVHGWFTEGFETADLRAARALLDALA